VDHDPLIVRKRVVCLCRESGPFLLQEWFYATSSVPVTSSRKEQKSIRKRILNPTPIIRFTHAPVIHVVIRSAKCRNILLLLWRF
jgi:hypothetical protein